ncbi:hypothetical protein os1_21670 [Comamonadaceae bacterium OS-1]|nr:hypothetical protein os1_21670 [Comamonadaceae bacterium OS-1]
MTSTIRWIQAIQWAQNTEAAVRQAQGALALYIQILTLIAASPWWAPGPLVRLARDMLPNVRTASGYVGTLVREGSKLIQDFVQDLLGEHAVWVDTAARLATATVMQRQPAHNPHQVHAKAAAQANAKRGHTGEPGHGGKSADPAKNTLKDPHAHTGGQAKSEAGTGHPVVDGKRQKTIDLLSRLSKRPSALVAEHMVDYHVLAKEGGQHPHGTLTAQKPGVLVKVNGPLRPTELTVEDLTRLSHHGIDSLWRRGSQTGPGARYLVVEAKGRIGAPSVQVQPTAEEKRSSKNGNTRNGGTPPVAGSQLTPHQAQLSRMLSDSGGKGAAPVMQMSREWIKKDMRVVLQRTVSNAEYERRVYLVAEIANPQAPTAPGYGEHVIAITQAGTAALAGAVPEVDPQRHASTHGISREYLEADIAAVEKAREGRPSPTTSAPPDQSKPADVQEGKRKKRTR